MVDFSDTPAQAAWRQEVAAFVEEALPAKLRDDARYGALGGPGSVPTWPDPDEHDRAEGEFRDALIERGWAAPAWPREYGGAELPVDQQFILNEVLAEYRAPRAGVLDVGSTIMVHASEELKRRFLPGFVEGKDKWAQGYSEPGSGSDLASLRTRADRDGDDFVLNGQKIWTSRANEADWMFGLFRTNPDAPKHRGITYLLLEMDTPGISVRPLEQINGRDEFNEVFFEDVRVPVDQAVGEINRGWYVGATHLDFERSSIGSALTMLQTLGDLFELIEEEEADQPAARVDPRRSPTLRGEIADRWTEANVARLFSYRVISMQLRDEVPNYEASMQKLFTDQLVQGIARTAMKALGLYGPLWDGEDERTVLRAKWSRGYLGAIATTIGGGTSEIQRNIIATRGLGLPRG
ncbi:MAG: hypothetical protein F4X25_13020 [Chloroflexi bacterium]|nr:hypothetical protein [Chloroflexota bacterium]